MPVRIFRRQGKAVHLFRISDKPLPFKAFWPLLDRIDLQIDVPRLTPEELLNTKTQEEPSSQIRQRVIKARKIQAERYKNEGILTNSELTPQLVKKYCKIDRDSEAIFKAAIVKYQLSGRRYDRVLKLARTIADLDGSELITQQHLMQALQYRVFNSAGIYHG